MIAIAEILTAEGKPTSLWAHFECRWPVTQGTVDRR